MAPKSRRWLLFGAGKWWKWPGGASHTDHDTIKIVTIVYERLGRHVSYISHVVEMNMVALLQNWKWIIWILKLDLERNSTQEESKLFCYLLYKRSIIPVFATCSCKMDERSEGYSTTWSWFVFILRLRHITNTYYSWVLYSRCFLPFAQIVKYNAFWLKLLKQKYNNDCVLKGEI